MPENGTEPPLCYSEQMFKAFLCIACFAASGCSTARAPIAQYQSSRVTASNHGAISLDIHFNLSNNNDDPLRLVKYKYFVSINGTTVYNGSAAAEQTLPRRSTSSSSIPAVVRREYLTGQDPVVWRLQGSLEYIAHGALAETLVESKLIQPLTSIVASDTLVIPSVE